MHQKKFTPLRIWTSIWYSSFDSTYLSRLKLPGIYLVYDYMIVCYYSSSECARNMTTFPSIKKHGTKGIDSNAQFSLAQGKLLTHIKLFLMPERSNSIWNPLVIVNVRGAAERNLRRLEFLVAKEQNRKLRPPNNFSKSVVYKTVQIIFKAAKYTPLYCEKRILE